MTDAALDAFSAATRSWFQASFTAPTKAHIGAWQSINSGQHALVIAPTGSGDVGGVPFGNRQADTATDDEPPAKTHQGLIFPLKAPVLTLNAT